MSHESRTRMRFAPFAGLMLALIIAVGGCGDAAEDGGSQDAAAFALPADPASYKPVKGFAAMPVPAENPMTLAKADLGRHLFFDERLSGDGKLSCYSCHLNDKGLADGRPVAIGAFEKKLTRNSPTLWNIGYHTQFYWDGRKDKLEDQAMAAWTGGNMGAKGKVDEICATLGGIEAYATRFEDVFGGPPTPENVVQALCCYMRTIVSRETAWDRHLAGEEGAVSARALRGYEVFKKANCEQCHSGVLFTDMQFHNVGIGMDAENPDVGHYKVTNRQMHIGAFKTPTLRDVVDSGPYFHDGSVASLEEAVRMMAKGGIENPHLESRELLKVNDLSDDEIGDILEFLKALDEPTELLVPEVP